MTNDHCASKPDISSMPTNLRHGGSILDPRFHALRLLAHTAVEEAKRASNDAGPSKKPEPQFLAFPSPTRKRRSTLQNPDTEEANCQGPQSSYPCVFNRID
ncbi:unnamed protein product [Microthlaspi erraticum]|uniref:Uncharacterized protein n=1 Tax=Microthlaspi erraticum TaxID=1685480 RepID=A0A6D2IFZ4_9BRAS|nr:unnamed protein product [Microthlaspi erraticum]